MLETKVPTTGIRLTLLTTRPKVVSTMASPIVAPNPHAIPPIKLFMKICLLVLSIFSCGSMIKLYYNPKGMAISFIEFKTISINFNKGIPSFSSQVIIETLSAPLANDFS